jgi:ATP-dependent phosphofructokinase / diphosphate-dependent phosphofructokinase
MSSIVIAQGGGPTAVINQTLCGAILAARRHDPSLQILGARHGVRGLTADNVVDLTAVPEADLHRLGNTPSSALGSTRDKPDPGTCSDILAALDRLDARAFVYIGGNDTAGTLELLRQQSSGPCHFVHAPKTIDNDLMENDHVPGFISAAAFVANALVSIDLDFRAMPGIHVAIVMGRHAGFLTAAAAGWQQSPDDAPHLIYTPEQPFSVPRFLDEVEAVYARLGRCIVSMSEGVQDEMGRPLTEALAGGAVERDAHGNLQLTGGDLGIEIQKALKSRFRKARARVVDAIWVSPSTRHRWLISAMTSRTSALSIHASAVWQTSTICIANLPSGPDDRMMPGTASTIWRSLYSLSRRASSAR